jgi:chromosomal replication initiation ATPase DnaA
MGEVMEESIQFKRYHEGLRLRNVRASDALLSRLVRFHNEKPKRSEPIPPDFDDDDLAPITMMVRRIQQLVCREFKIPMRDLIAVTRKPSQTLPRQVAYYLAKEHTLLSLPGIGRKFDRDHSTIFYGINVIKKRLDTDADLGSTVRRIEEQLQ